MVVQYNSINITKKVTLNISLGIQAALITFVKFLLRAKSNVKIPKKNKTPETTFTPEQLRAIKNFFQPNNTEQDGRPFADASKFGVGGLEPPTPRSRIGYSAD